MIPEMERRLAAFVDRKSEMERFCGMLETGEKPIMIVWGEAGLGKTSLFYRMMHECTQRNLRQAELVWSDTRNHDYLAVMSKLRDNLGAQFFEDFTKALNDTSQYQVSIDLGITGTATVGEGMSIKDSNVGDVAMFKNNTFVLPMADRAALEKNRMAALTDKFKSGLSEALKNGPLVVFFDAVEKMSADTSKWVWCELLQAVAEGSLGRIVVVLCGREKPQLDREMEFIVEEAELKPLAEPDIYEFLTKRCVDQKVDWNDEVRKGMAKMLLISTRGKPDEVAYAVEGALKALGKKPGG